MPGLDPGIWFQWARDCRVKPGNDDYYDDQFFLKSPNRVNPPQAKRVWPVM
jgi:hypothetical protein